MKLIDLGYFFIEIFSYEKEKVNRHIRGPVNNLFRLLKIIVYASFHKKLTHC